MTGKRPISTSESLNEFRLGDDSGTPLVSCAEAACTFGIGQNAVVAVHGVTCTIHPGDRVALIGPSGSGKSTLLHLMSGLQHATAGTVGWPALDGHPLAVPGRVGIVFQGPSLLPALDSAENVALPLLLGDTPPPAARRRAAAALSALGIADLAHKLPEQLSGGQAQRVVIARVLACEPKLILADEPTGQLDHATAAVVMDVLLDAAQRLSAGLIVSTHDPTIAARLDQQWAMQDGALRVPNHPDIDAGAVR